MRRTSFAGMNCSVAGALEIVGEWWTFLVLRDAFLGVRRFEDFQRRLGIARNVLTARLQTLVSHGILERRRYQERPERYEYRLTRTPRNLRGAGASTADARVRSARAIRPPRCVGQPARGGRVVGGGDDGAGRGGGRDGRPRGGGGGVVGEGRDRAVESALLA